MPMGGGIDLSSSNVVYQALTNNNTNVNITVTSKPQYILLVYGQRPSSIYVNKIIFQDVNNETYTEISNGTTFNYSVNQSGIKSYFTDISSSQITLNITDTANSNYYTSVYVIY